jgi:hypothetical protein
VRLDKLRDRALRQNYLYLAALATALGYVASAQLRLTERNYVDEPILGVLTAFPIVRCHWTAAKILAAGELSPELVADFLRALGRCEGVKGHRGFVLRALARVEDEGDLSDILRAFAQRWRARFSWTTEATAEAITFACCDYRTCEARCCYDGVYLVGDEDEKIRTVVARHPEFFRHLPREFLVNGAWHGISGVKTAVRPHQYQSPDFPDHFNHTRCVFAYEDGACSLQDFSTRHGASPYEFKPISCIVHPLTTTAAGVVRPEYAGADSSYVDLEYPGFASFTPCGQPRSDGQPWEIVFATELAIWRGRQKEALGE